MVFFEKITILYGSETGNCQDLAKIIAWSMSKLAQNLELEVEALNDYSIQNLPQEQFIVFICSTTGIGEVPNNMKQFWKFLLRRDLSQDSLNGLVFTVIGLGDSSYSKYNFVAKKLFKRLLALGGTKLLDLVLGDDQHELGPFINIDPWLKDLYGLLFPDTINKIIDDDKLIEPSFKITLTNQKRTSPNLFFNNDNCQYSVLNPFFALVISNERVTSEDHFQDVRLITLKINETIPYQLSHVCVVYHQNQSEDVEMFLDLFKNSSPPIDGDQSFSLTVNKSKCWIPKSSFYFHLLKTDLSLTVRDLIAKYMDIMSVPKRSFFDLFYRFSRDNLEKEKLKRFASGIDLDELYDYVNRPKRTILEVMIDFPNTTPYIPFEYLFDLIPAITPRSYSIASSPSRNNLTIDLLYAVVNYRTRLRKPRLGQCTNWMASCKPLESYLPIFLRENSFKLPQSSQPVVMISAGTGVAPFRAIIQDRVDRNIKDNFLFFGCRYKNSDYYLSNEWNSLIEKKCLTLFVAFSREDPEKKVYVQHVVWQQRDLIYQLFSERDAVILIAGKSQQYPQLVRETLVNIFKEKSETKLNSELIRTEYFENLVNRFENQKRIQFECW